MRTTLRIQLVALIYLLVAPALHAAAAGYDPLQLPQSAQNVGGLI